MKRLITFLLFIGLFAMATNVQANEGWFKTLTKSQTSFVIGGGFEVGLHKQKAYQFQAKIFNHYVGYSCFNSWKTTDYRENINGIDYYYNQNSVYYGYGFNLGNIYELIHNSDNFGYKIFNRINIVPLFRYDWFKHPIVDKADKQHRFSYIIDVNVIKFYNLGLNLQLTDIHKIDSKVNNHKQLFLNFNLRF